MERVCTVCGREYAAGTGGRGLCPTHHSRWLRGTPLDVPVGSYEPRGTACAIEGCDQPVLARGWCQRHYESTKPCSVAGCDEPHLSRGFCKLHYRRALSGLPLEAPKRPRWDTGVCSVAGCEQQTYGRGWCKLHYYRERRHGDPLWEPPGPVERFWAMVDASGDCWEWRGARVRGYGTFKVDRKQLRAHRFAYELLVGPIPPGLELDHLCANPGCVNPAHLEPVTTAENVSRMWARKRAAAGG